MDLAIKVRELRRVAIVPLAKVDDATSMDAEVEDSSESASSSSKPESMKACATEDDSGGALRSMPWEEEARPKFTISPGRLLPRRTLKIQLRRVIIALEGSKASVAVSVKA